MNLKYCKVNLDNCSFKSNKADQVDLDFCWAVLSNCSFSPSRIDPNGDGLDVSGSNISVGHCEFQGFVDKGVSAGENSVTFLWSNSFYDNRSAVTIKDESKTYAWGNKFSNNESDYSLFIKKMIFGKPILFKEKGSPQHVIENIEGEVKEMEKVELTKFHEDFLNRYNRFDSVGTLRNMAQ